MVKTKILKFNPILEMKIKTLLLQLALAVLEFKDAAW